MILPALACKNCSHPLPLPNALCPSPEQTAWPMGYLELAFLCPVCKHAYIYPARDVDQRDCGVPSLADKVRNVVQIILPCWEVDCKGRVPIHTLMAWDANAREEAPAMLAQATAHGVRCTEGHFLLGTMPRFGPLDAAHFDPRWGPGNL
jgi:hypothetical protein